MRALASALSIVLVAASGRAQDSDDVIEGELVRPDSQLVSGPPEALPDGDPSPVIDRLARRIAVEPSPALAMELATQLTARSRNLRLLSFGAQEQVYAARRRGDAAGLASAQSRARSLESRADADRSRAIDVLQRASAAEPALRVRALALRLHLLEEAGRHAEAGADAAAIVELAPQSAEAARAHLHLGERYFAEADLLRAMAHYRAVLAAPGASAHLRGYAHYKLGWSHLNLADFAAAWSELARCREVGLATGDSSGARLAREAARDSLHALIGLRLAPGDSAARIAALSTSREERGRLARRYEEMLRDVGLAPDADAFARAWAARGPPE